MSDQPQSDQDESRDIEYVEKTMDLGMQIAEFDPTPYMRQIRGKGGSQTDYLDVKHRLLWLRKEHPDAEIVTELIRIDDAGAIFKATVSIPGGGRATGHGSETATDFSDYIEKAETKALGRALNALGYGAQFAEGEGDDVRPGSSQAQYRPSERRDTRSRRASQTSEASPAPGSSQLDVKESTPLADYSWTAFWEWARGQGYESKDELERVIERSMTGMNPAEIRELLANRPG